MRIKDIFLQFKNTYVFDILICLTITFLIFSISLVRPWIFYDEDVIYNELYSPIPSSIDELFEVLGSFGLINNIGSNNFLYSSNIANRTSIFGTPLLLILGLLFKKNAFLYHLANLSFHLINTYFVYLILRRIFTKINYSRFLVFFLTLTWAIHPVQIESILLSTNIGATISYMFFFILFYDFLINKERNDLLIRKIMLSVLFVLPMFLNEYIIALPFILIVYTLLENYKTYSLKQTFMKTWQVCNPYIIGLLMYLIYFTFSRYSFFQQTNGGIKLILERILWLSPQIIFHNLKLLFFPRILSIDQSAHIFLTKEIFSPYAIFCLLFITLIITVPLILFIWKRKCYSFVLYILMFFISLIPFSQILSPTYALAAERYLYTPLFFLILGSAIFLNHYLTNSLKAKFTIIALIIITSSFGIRSLIRINDWKNNENLITSTIKTSPNNLYKGFRTKNLAGLYKKTGNKEKAEALYKKADKYFLNAIAEYKQSPINKLQEPIILKAYGLDTYTLLLKAGYQRYIDEFVKDKSNIPECLAFFNNNIHSFEEIDPFILELYANLILESGNKNSAKGIFLYAYKKYPYTPSLLVSLIRFERDIENNLENTKKYIETARSIYPYSKDILFETLRYNQKTGNFKEYVNNAYLYGLRAHSKFTYLEALTGFLSLGNLEMARKTTEKLLTLDPTDPKIYYLSAGYHIKEKDYEKAISLLNEGRSLLDENQKDIGFNINNALANLYFVRNNHELALLYTQEALNCAKGDTAKLAKMQRLVDKLGI